MWRWDQQEPFGDSAPNEDPDGDSVVFSFSLRFPGQYADAESNLNYNYFRDYHPPSGRYVESDPIGLAGGPNAYAYTLDGPLRYIDPTGLSGYSGSPAIPPIGPYGPTNTVSFGAGGGLQYYFWGGSAESGFAIETRGGNACFYTRTCRNKAFGAEVDLGVSVSASPGKLCSGTKKETSYFFSGGDVVGGGLGFPSEGGIARGAGGFAVGAVAGKNVCTTTYHCLVQ